MSFADLKKLGATLTVTRAGQSVALTVSLGAEACGALAALFQAAAEGHKEVRVGLPDYSDDAFPVAEEWSLFAKASTGSDRALLAHPSEKEWVGSLLFSAARLKGCAVALSELETRATGEEWDIEAAGRLRYPSNLKLRFLRA